MSSSVCVFLTMYIFPSHIYLGKTTRVVMVCGYILAIINVYDMLVTFTCPMDQEFALKSSIYPSVALQSHVGSIKLVLWFWGVDNVLYISHSRMQVTV